MSGTSSGDRTCRDREPGSRLSGIEPRKILDKIADAWLRFQWQLTASVEGRSLKNSGTLDAFRVWGPGSGTFGKNPISTGLALPRLTPKPLN